MTLGDYQVTKRRHFQLAPSVIVHEDQGLVGGRHAARPRRAALGDLVQARLELGVHAGRLVVVRAGAVAQVHGVLGRGHDPIGPAQVSERHLDRLTAAPSLSVALLVAVRAPGPRIRCRGA